ncbi:MAG TPA: Ig domain-containing protein [bacterium]|nr:Ig domain-containing protein [bacterium]
MKPKLFFILICLSLIPCCAVAGTSKSGGDYEILQDAIGTHGSASSTGDNYSLHSTIGQASSSPSGSYLNYSLVSGFMGVVDETPPQADFSSPTASSSASGTVDIIGTAFDINGTVWSIYIGAGSEPAEWNELISSSGNITNGTMSSWDSGSNAGTYTLKIVATDGRGNTATGTVTFNVDNTISIAGTISAFKWILLGIPVQPSPPDPVSIFGENGEYKIYRWDPEAADDEYVGKYRSPSQLLAGYGLWIKAYDEDIAYSYQGGAVDTSGEYTIDIKEGWNQIASPYNSDFAWGSVRVRNNGQDYSLTDAADAGLISMTLYGYDSDASSWVQYDPAGTMEVQKGYLVRSYSDSELVFEPGAGILGLSRIVRPVFDYRIRISASSGNSADTDNYIGTAGTAKDGFDVLDAEEPPKTLEDKYTMLYFPRDDMETNPGNYASDFRSLAAKAGNIQQWDFNVETSETGETVTLSWDNSDLPTELYEFALVIYETGERINMAEQSTYTYTATGDPVSETEYKIIVIRLESDIVTRSYTLNPGWNLISVPLEPELTGALSQLGDDLPMLNVYQLFDNRYYDSEQVDIQAGLGYWIYVDRNTEIDIVGLPVPSGTFIEVPVQKGWNLIGNPFDMELAWGDNIQFEFDGTKMSLSSAASQNKIGEHAFIFNGSGYEALTAGAVIGPWKGFFIFSSLEGKIIIQR